MTSQNSQPAKNNAKPSPFLWFHLILMAIAPWLLVMTMAGLAVGDPLLPSWLEISILSLPAIALPAWWQWQQPFSPFSLWLATKPSAKLSDRDRQTLALLKQQNNGWYITGWLAIAVAVLISGIFCKLYGLSPLAQAIAPFPDGFRFFGIIYAEICLFLSNIVLQSGISALRLHLVAEAQLSQVQPMAIDKIKNSFTSFSLLPEQLAAPLLNLFEVDAPSIDERDISTPSQPLIQASQDEVLPALEVTQEVTEPALETIEVIEVSSDKPIESGTTEIATLSTTEEAIAELKETAITNEVEIEQETVRSHEEIVSEFEEVEELVGDQVVEALVTNLVSADALLNQELDELDQELDQVHQEVGASISTPNPVDELIEETVLESEEIVAVVETDELIEESSLENDEEISDAITDVSVAISSEDTGEELVEEMTLEKQGELALELSETNTVNELLNETVFINEANEVNEDLNLAVIETEELSEDLALKQEEVIADSLADEEISELFENSILEPEELILDVPTTNTVNEFLEEPKLENPQVDQEVKQSFEKLIEEANIEITVDTDEKAIAEVSETANSSIHKSFIEELGVTVDQNSGLQEDLVTSPPHPTLDLPTPSIPIASLPVSTPKSSSFGFNLSQKSRKPKPKTQGFGRTVRQEPVAAPTDAESSLIESLPEQQFTDASIDESDSSDNSTNNLNDSIDEVEELDEKAVLDNYAENILYEYFAEPSADVLERSDLENNVQSDQDIKENSAQPSTSELTLEQKPQAYLVEEVLMDKFFAKLEKLNNSDRLSNLEQPVPQKDTSSESSEIDQSGSNQSEVDEFDALAALIDRDQNPQA